MRSSQPVEEANPPLGSDRPFEAVLARAISLEPSNPSLVVDLLDLNRYESPGKLEACDRHHYLRDLLAEYNYAQVLPQRNAMTSTFMTDVIDPATTAIVPTGVYRVTMRKLLRLSLEELQQQARLMEIDTVDLTEEGVATRILMALQMETPLIARLARLLISKELAFVFGVRLAIPLDSARPASSAVYLVLRPHEMINSSILTKQDLESECSNQGVTYSARDTSQKLATRLIAWWREKPSFVREPFTAPFTTFLLDRMRTRTS